MGEPKVRRASTASLLFLASAVLSLADASAVALIDGADVTSALQDSTICAQLGRDTFGDIRVRTGGVDASTPLGLGPVLTGVTQLRRSFTSTIDWGSL